jgi:adenine-specific DNA-methyltransferase
VVYSSSWRGGKPTARAGGGQILKYCRLESYEDSLNNLDVRRTATQQTLLDAAEAQGADGLKEQYLLRYMLDVETRGSQSLLNMQAFKDPTAYKLKVKRPGSDESREVNVDLLETFNYLIGLTVQHIAVSQSFAAEFERDSEKRPPQGPPQARRRRAVVVPHRHRHHARRAEHVDHLAQAQRRSRAGQLGARRVVQQTGLLDQGL